MSGEGGVVEERGDGFCREVNGFDGAIDDAGDGLAAEGDADDGTGAEILSDCGVFWGGIGKNAAILAEKFAGNDLVVHRFIILGVDFLCTV